VAAAVICTEAGAPVVGAMYRPEELIVPVAAKPPTALSTIQDVGEILAPPCDALNCKVCPGIRRAEDGVTTTAEASDVCESLEPELPPPHAVTRRAINTKEMPNEDSAAERSTRSLHIDRPPPPHIPNGNTRSTKLLCHIPNDQRKSSL
jgi:hypothetical protein